MMEPRVVVGIEECTIDVHQDGDGAHDDDDDDDDGDDDGQHGNSFRECSGGPRVIPGRGGISFPQKLGLPVRGPRGPHHCRGRRLPRW